MPRIKEIFNRLDALEKYMEASQAIQGDEYGQNKDNYQLPVDGLSERDKWFYEQGCKRVFNIVEDERLLAKNAPPADSLEIGAFGIAMKESSIEIKRLEAEIALRGERLFVLWKHYEEYLNITEPNWVAFNAWFKDGKYIGEVGNGVKKKTCKCRVHYSMLDNGATCKSCGRIVEASDG